MSDVQESVEIIFASIQVSGKITVINPDVHGVIQTNCIAIVCIHP
jgi:hypothetical protein